MSTRAEQFTLYLDESGIVANTPVRVGALRVVGGVVLKGDEAAHEALRGSLAEAFHGIECDWRATELSRLCVARGEMPSWLIREIEDLGGTEAQFKRGLGPTYAALRLRLRGTVPRRVGAVIHRHAGAEGAALVCFEHDTVGASGRRDAMLGAIVEHAAWMLGARRGPDAVTLHVIVEASGDEAAGGRCEYSAGAAAVAAADALVRARGGRGVRAGDCSWVPARELTGSKKGGPPGLVLADFVANAFGPGGSSDQPFSESEAGLWGETWFRRRFKNRLAEGKVAALACGAGPSAEALRARLRGEKPAQLDPSLRLRSDVQASWDFSRSLQPWCGR